MSMHTRLFIPGPVDVAPDVLQKMATPQIGHRTKEASVLQKSIHDKMQKVLYTENTIMLSTSSGSGFMEGSIRSCTRKRAAVFSIGAFGDRWYKMAVTNNVPADKFSPEPGQPTMPADVEKALATGLYDVVTVTHNETSVGIQNPVEEIGEVIKAYNADKAEEDKVLYLVDAVSSAAGAKIEVDAIGIDCLITSTQKALGLPAGLAICSFSQRAYNAAKQVQFRGLYFDMVEIFDTIQKKNHQYPSTPTLAHMFALDYQLDRIMLEGIENRFARHTEMAQYVRAWARKHFGTLVKDDKYASNTLTTILKPEGFDIKELNKRLAMRGYTVSDGYGVMKDKTFRIAHMADATLADVRGVLFEIEEILGLK
jgi:aspartate aminotransferase-like enzyme